MDQADRTGSGIGADGFGVGVVRAVRTFRVGHDGGLYPLSTDQPWTAGDNTACCRLGREHRAPASDCRCGFYAYGHPAWAAAQPPARSVLAVVALWGSIEVASRGLRAEHGRVEALWLHPRRVRPELRQLLDGRYPNVQVYEDREQLLEQHPLTALEGVQPPRLRGLAPRLLAWLWALLAAVVAGVGAVPATDVITSEAGGALWMTAFAVPLLAVLAALVIRSAVAATAGWLGLGWMLSSTSDTLQAVWLSRLPLLAGIALAIAVWLDQATPGRVVPRWYTRLQRRSNSALRHRWGWR